MKQSKLQDALLKVYIGLVKKHHKIPTKTQLFEAGYARDKIRYYFGNMAKLRATARQAEPKIFEGVNDSEILAKTSKKRLSRAVRVHKRFLITTVVSGQPAHKGFLKNLKAMEADTGAHLLLLPGGRDLHLMDKILAAETFVFEDVDLNSNLTIRGSFRVPPKNINPLTSLSRIGQRENSSIIASPKQFLQMIGTSNVKLPHALMSTGAITRSKYESHGRQNRVDYIASHDHVLGALVVEIVDRNIYHFRQIQAERSGAFVDLGTYYADGQISKLAPEAIVMGDYHVTETDLKAKQAWFELAAHSGAKQAIMHDFFSGVSINHHEEQDQVRRAQLMEDGLLSLEDECRAAVKALDELTERFEKVVIVESNHHDFLRRYIREGKYRWDPQNLRFASKLVAPMIAGANPLQHAMQILLGLKRPERVIWLTRDDEFKIAGIQCAAHGDVGANGKRNPGAVGMESAYGNVMYGHTHTRSIMRGAWCVGTTSRLKLNYNPGASSWDHASGLIYPNSSRQLIGAIDGQWRLKGR